MKITIALEGGRTLVAKHAYHDSDHVVVDGLDACPACKHPAPVKVSGDGRRTEGHDTYACNAIALCCRRRIGTVRVRVSTIFGVEEDERVLNGRARVY